MAEASQTAPRDSIGSRARTGLLWTAGVSLFRDVLQFGVMLIMVRLLDPRAYGEFAMVTACVGFIGVFSFRSFLEYTLQMRPDETPDYRNYFAIGGIIQAAALTSVNILASVLRMFPSYSPIAVVLHVMSVYFLLDWVAELRVKMLERSLAWTRLRLLQAAGFLLSAAASIVLGAAGAGVYALVLPGLLVTMPFIYDLFIASRWRPTWTAGWKEFRSAWRYGLTRIGSGMAARSQQLLEGAVIVGVLGFAAYGVYGRAVGLAAIACGKLTSLLTVTLFPVLTQLPPGSAGYRQVSALVLRAAAWTVLPAAALFGILAAPLVHILYGAKWEGAAPLLPWALAAGSLSALTQTAGLLLLANLQPKRCLVSDVWILCGTGLSLAFVLPRGAAEYLLATAAVQAVSLTLMLKWLVSSRAISVPGIRHALLPSVVAVALLIAGGTALRPQFDIAANAVPTALLAGSVFFLLYLAALRIASAQPLLELLDHMPASRHLRRVLLFQGSI